MSFRFRRSKGLGKLARINVSKRGVGMSFGAPGARVSTHSSGRVTRTARLPGTGFYYRKDTTSGARRRGSRRQQQQAQAEAPASPSAPPPPGCFAPRADKRLWRAANAADVAALRRHAERHPAHGRISRCLAVALTAEQDPPTAAGLAREALDRPWTDTERHFADRHLHHMGFPAQLAPGVEVQVPVTELPEVLTIQTAQEHDDHGGAARLADSLAANDPRYRPLAVAAHLAAGNHDQVVALTDGIANNDDETMFLVTLRAAALREQELLEASREALREALKQRVREPGLRHRALLERARTYLAQGQPGRARRDCERIIGEDSTVEGVQELLAEIGD